MGEGAKRSLGVGWIMGATTIADPPPRAKVLGRSAGGFVRREVTARVKLRVSPEIFFTFDESLGEGDKIERLLKQVRSKEGW